MQCSVQQRLALGKVVNHRLAPDSPGYRWLPFCLLESIGLWLVPPAAEDKPVADDKQLEPQVVDEMYVTLAKINLRNAPGGPGSKQTKTIPAKTPVHVKWSLPNQQGRTWVCCHLLSGAQYGHTSIEYWTQLRSADGQRQLKRADGSEDLALRNHWEGLPAPRVAFRYLRQSKLAAAYGYGGSSTWCKDCDGYGGWQQSPTEFKEGFDHSDNGWGNSSHDKTGAQAKARMPKLLAPLSPAQSPVHSPARTG